MTGFNLKDILNSREIPKKTIVLKRKELLVREGQTDTSLYFIKEGALLAYVMDEENEQIIRFGYKNEFIAAIDSFISEKPTQFFIQAVKKTHLLQIQKKPLMNLVYNNPAILLGWLEMIQQLTLQQLERERDLLTTSPKQRVQRVLHRSPRLFQEIPLKYIANYLRMSPETLSRLKNS